MKQNHKILILILVIMIASFMAGIFGCSNNTANAKMSIQKLPLGYTYKFVEIEGVNCVLVTNLALPEGIAIDCDWRK